MAKVLAVLLGIAVGAMLPTMIFLADSANSAKQDARDALAQVEGNDSSAVVTGSNATNGGSTHDHSTNGGTDSQVAISVSDTAHDTAAALESYAGQLPDNAEELAAAHEPFPSELPPVPDGDVVEVPIVLKDVTIDIAPGVKYAAWGFEGGAPGPV